MTQPRKYRDVHPSNQSQASKAAADYEKGSYENRNAVQSPLYMEYHMAYFDLVALEMSDLNDEVQGN
tara:strand:+ start:494 stop:694 length:201 start_codon:yes stop_codon:yes gene_type:complete